MGGRDDPRDLSRVHLLTVPNAVTLVRTAGAVWLGALAIGQRSAGLAVAAYLTYWIGDMLDGWIARRLGQETRFGAVFDIAADRLCCLICIVPLLQWRPQMAVPCGIFLAQFMVVDLVLSLSFLRWGLLSPNYFHLVHRAVYRWNWSPPAKACNTSALVLLAVFVPTAWPAIAVAVAVVVVKLVSLAVVRRMPGPAGGPAAATTGLAAVG